MPKVKILQDESMMQQIFYMDKLVINKLKAYALETGTSFFQMIDPELTQFKQALIKKCTEVDEIRRKALQAEMKQQEEARIAAENPIQVTGIPVDPLAAI